MVNFMKRAFTFILAFVFCFISVLSINSLLKESKHTSVYYSDRVNLIIDAGHGGRDVGTVGADNAFEKDINLAIALKLYDFARVCGYSAFLVRDEDKLCYKENEDTNHSDLYSRMDFINSIPNATLISIHQNHFADEREWGMQIWYSPNDNDSKILADSILDITKDNLQKENKRENKKSDSSYYLLYKAKVPSVMVECGFMSNIEENKRLQESSYQNRLAYSIMLGFNDYITKEK